MVAGLCAGCPDPMLWPSGGWSQFINMILHQVHSFQKLVLALFWVGLEPRSPRSGDCPCCMSLSLGLVMDHW